MSHHYSWVDPGLRTEWFGRTGFRVYVPAAERR